MQVQIERSLRCALCSSSRSDGMSVAGGFNPRCVWRGIRRRGSDAVTGALGDADCVAIAEMSSCRFATAFPLRSYPGVKTPGYTHTVASRRATTSNKQQVRACLCLFWSCTGKSVARPQADSGKSAGMEVQGAKKLGITQALLLNDDASFVESSARTKSLSQAED
ncbi:MAG: hypothetical protein RL095_1895 [Verrucomicrobiota bacterium]|jgi:hypothetical protein